MNKSQIVIYGLTDRNNYFVYMYKGDKYRREVSIKKRAVKDNSLCVKRFRRERGLTNRKENTMQNTECQTMTVPEAAKLLGYTPDYLRWLMREKKVDIGMVHQRKKGGRYEYKVCKPKLDKLLGITS